MSGIASVEINSGLPLIVEELKKSLLNSFLGEASDAIFCYFDEMSCHGHLALANVLRRSGKLGMLLPHEFLIRSRDYKFNADPSASLERRHTVNEFGSRVERHRRELPVGCNRVLGPLAAAADGLQETSLRAWRYRDSVKEGAPLHPWLYRLATHARLESMSVVWFPASSETFQ